MKKSIIFSLLTVLLLSSCVSQHTKNKTYFRPDKVRLEMTMQDFEYLGDVTVSAEYKKYFGIFRKRLTINDEAYNPRVYTKSYLKTDPGVRVGSTLNLAMYKVLDTYPEATFIIPANQKKVVEHMNGGRIIREEMTLKVYKLR